MKFEHDFDLLGGQNASRPEPEIDWSEKSLSRLLKKRSSEGWEFCEFFSAGTLVPPIGSSVASGKHYVREGQVGIMWKRPVD